LPVVSTASDCINIYDPYSKQRAGNSTPRLLILNGHGSHITFDFIDFCEKTTLCTIFPPHPTHLPQPLDVGLFGPLHHHYAKAVEDYFLTTDVSVNCDTFFPLFKKLGTRRIVSIQNAFRACGMISLCFKVVMDKL
jgi:hypothetical protein